jgi:homoserine dehydrogenase
MRDVEARYYLRFGVADRPGVMGRLAGALGETGVSIEQIVQHGLPDAGGGPVEVVMVTHRAREGALRAALSAIASEEFVRRDPKLFRIEDL